MKFRSIIAPFADFIKDEPVIVASGAAAFVAWLVAQFGLSVETTNLIRMAVVALLAILARYSVTPSSKVEEKDGETPPDWVQDAIVTWLKKYLDDQAKTIPAPTTVVGNYSFGGPVAPPKPKPRRTRKAASPR